MATRHNLCENPCLSVSDADWAFGADGPAVPTRTDVTGLGFVRNFAARYTSGTFLRTPNGAAVAGTQYTLSCYIRPQALGASGTIYAEWRRANNTVISYSDTSYNVAANTVGRCSITATAPADTAFVRIIMDGVNFGAVTVDVTAVLYEAAATAGTYFDGDSPSASWDGTAGLSASTFVDSVTGTVTVNLGPLTSTAVGVRGVAATAAINLGSLTTVGGGTRGVAGSGSVGLGALTISGSGTPSETVVERGSWYTLLDIAREARKLAEAELSQPPQACPNDGEPLRRGRNGILHCSFDGWTYQ